LHSVLFCFIRSDVEFKLFTNNLLIHIENVLRGRFEVRSGIIAASNVKVILSRIIGCYKEVTDRDEYIKGCSKKI